MEERLTEQSVNSRVIGILRGISAGDRIGGPIRMALHVAESLVDERRFNSADILRRYVAWWRTEGFDAGRVGALVFDAILCGERSDAAASRVDRELGGMTAGCNPAHRAAPLAMCRAIADRDLREAALNEARLTHLHPAAGEVSATVVHMCRHLIRGADWDTAVWSSGATIPDRINPSGYAPDVLGAALFFVSVSRDFEESLSRAFRFAGAANFCPIVAGALAGARWGAGAIPESMIQHDQGIRDRVARAAGELASRW
jgi:ADP-ribosylglycohydrolase